MILKRMLRIALKPFMLLVRLALGLATAMLHICEALNMTPVPIEEIGMDLPSRYPTVETLLARADGDYPNGGKKEGIVIRPTEPVFCPLISTSLSMKIVSNKYLLKSED